MTDQRKDTSNLEQIKQHGDRDQPEQYPTDNESLLDMFESEMHVDPIPMEDLNMEQKEEKQKEKTKNSSSSPAKYHSGFE